MGDLISRSALLDVVRYQLDDALHGAELIGKTAFKQKATDCRNFIELIKSMPTIEAVPVIRCKDCESFCCGYPNRIGADGLCEYWDKLVDTDDYCSCGLERWGCK